ncbi:protein root UVB sensitive 3-like [Hibiscus syriacus]|uniref:protein root UVB sensitive 3-like n=1 Tax=Hibiscus syriacus TaxID=106335 RepID=UPI0019228FF8|nr:protein root UVB sensitive 3-like [Hibiscus syriacus]
MLSTQAILSAIGVGEKSATIIGATFQWFLRDLTGMLGGILFTLYQGSNLDSNAKMWRLVADLMNDLGMSMFLLEKLFCSNDCRSFSLSFYMMLAESMQRCLLNWYIDACWLLLSITH